jgi:hypothetical protein
MEYSVRACVACGILDARITVVPEIPANPHGFFTVIMPWLRNEIFAKRIASG